MHFTTITFNLKVREIPETEIKMFDETSYSGDLALFNLGLVGIFRHRDKPKPEISGSSSNQRARFGFSPDPATTSEFLHFPVTTKQNQGSVNIDAQKVQS
ncbi:hypothetical protein HHK36_032128 [Tetracentron sinense]|uniref:Uncharacterized protein n=1 Tax=Tetracentron sinense TaxID=13715 RepID=A0A834Y9M5_TETSI|nr:hypothetical protein HHK36_032128 [Tetracentron sinense]